MHIHWENKIRSLFSLNKQIKFFDNNCFTLNLSYKYLLFRDQIKYNSIQITSTYAYNLYETFFSVIEELVYKRKGNFK